MDEIPAEGTPLNKVFKNILIVPLNSIQSVLNHLKASKNGKIPSEQKSIDKDIKFISSRIRD